MEWKAHQRQKENGDRDTGRGLPTLSALLCTNDDPTIFVIFDIFPMLNAKRDYWHSTTPTGDCTGEKYNFKQRPENGETRRGNEREKIQQCVTRRSHKYIWHQIWKSTYKYVNWEEARIRKTEETKSDAIQVGPYIAPPRSQNAYCVLQHQLNSVPHFSRHASTFTYLEIYDCVMYGLLCKNNKFSKWKSQDRFSEALDFFESALRN